MATRFNEEVVFNGGFKNPGGYNTPVKQTEMEQNTSQLYWVPWTHFRVWDAMHTNLPGTAATDDLGLYGNTFGTGSASIEAGDLKAAGATTRYARFYFALPPEYDDSATVTLQAVAGMVTTVADTSCTLDFEVYESDKFAGIGSDICATAAQSMNSLTQATLSYTITATSLASGDLLSCRMAVACNDAATGTAVIPQVGWVGFSIDTRG